MVIYLLSNLLSYKKSIFEKVSKIKKNMIKNIDDSLKRKTSRKLEIENYGSFMINF